MESVGKSEAMLSLKDAAVSRLTTTGKHGKEVIEVCDHIIDHLLIFSY